MLINNPKKNKINEIIRVDHAGELGAKYIYEGQLKALGKDAIGNAKACEEIEEMKACEEVHLAYFEEKIRTSDARPSFLYPLWKAGAKLMGRVSGAMGPKYAMICTDEVEKVIDKHYQEQIDYLREEKHEMLTDIEKFQAEELEHMQKAREYNEDLPVVSPVKERVFAKMINLITRGAIRVAKVV